ncbi:conserved hypothetical protein [Leishmania major strain Friedlin]|uniref:SMP-LTD domain-containing protein n=1 Tax=Leishmania major TaxID=5664 RepID=Q4QGH3_LEIMA|nr:conserved hypothetical protein [Leishmania major strain Friedlin]CAG9570516.1 Putative_integral_membrane_protein_conserved_region_(DUF2404)_-_putative [Leishmania major strain Friedlin]CAJ03027.1 conserved hypothetical protein [Leishmania major strain Friedlin]|eukprot:XP_001681725.1 conserved hypothetical protein [Leishmania major strain Friedlin]
MAEVLAFAYGWVSGIVAVVVWILYGSAALPHLMWSVKSVCAHIPVLSLLVEGMAAQPPGMQDGDGASASPPFCRFDGAAVDQNLEGLQGSPMRVKPITASATCMMSWYRPDGTIGPPIECLLSLENNMVTVYQLLHLTDSSSGIMASGSTGFGNVHSKSKDARRESKFFRTATGVNVVEHRKGKVYVLNTTVMEVRQFNASKKTATAAADQLKPGTGDRGASGASAGEVASAKASSKAPSSPGLPGSFSSGGFASSGAQVTEHWEGTLNESMASAKGSMSRRSVAGSGAAVSGASETTAANLMAGSGGADSVFTGRVLIWRTVDGRPLFDSGTPLPQSFSSRTGNSTFADSCGHSVPFSTSRSHGAGGACTPRNARSTERVAGHSTDSSDAVDDGEDFTVADSEGGDAAAERRQQQAHRARSHHQRRWMMNDMASWSCVIIKFERSRECERWHTLLSGLKEADAWHKYAKTLPNPDTINTFLSRFFFQNMRLAAFSDTLIELIRKQLRSLPLKKFPRDLGGDLILDDLLIGTQIPWISDVSEPRVSANGEVGFDFNLFYKGGEEGLSLFFRLALTYCGIRIPHVVFSVKLLELEATVHVSIGPPPSKTFWVGAHKPPIIRLEVHQGCASGKGVLHRILTALPDLSGILTNFVKLYLFSDMVLPYMDDFPLPSVVKSLKGSFTDLRVRAFDWQRAAKISGAPHGGSFASGAGSNDGSPEGKAAERSIEQQVTSGHRSQLTPWKSSVCSTATTPLFASTGHASKGAVAPDSRDSLPPVVLDGRSVSSRLHAGVGAKFPAPASGDSDGNTGSFTSSCDANASRGVRSPLIPALHSSRLGSQGTRDSPTLPPGRAAPDRASDQTWLSATHLGNRSGSCSASVSSIPMSTSAMDDGLFCDNNTCNSESDNVMSSASKKRSVTSAAMRNLKNLLKVKGKDMTRESVSRSKKKS